MTSSKFDYTVIEDNGGSLHLFLFEPGKDTPCAGYEGFEDTPASLVESLNSLDAGDDTRGWGGAKANAREDWDYITGHDFGYDIICYAVAGSERIVMPDRMGRAGLIAFDVVNE